MPSSGQWKPTGQRRQALLPRFGWYVPSGHRVKFLFESPGQKAPCKNTCRSWNDDGRTEECTLSDQQIGL